MNLKSVKNIFGYIKKAFSNFMDDRGLKLSASLSYYTVFSLPALLFMLVGLGGLLFGKEAIQGEVLGTISEFVGPSVAESIQNMLKNISLDRTSVWATVFGGVLLFVTAAGIFAEIQDSINFVWSLKTKEKMAVKSLIMRRLFSFSMIIVLGVILVASMVLSVLLDTFIGQLKNIFPEDIVNLFYVLHYVIMLFLMVIIFTFLFKVLPDANLKIKDVLPGAIFTSILFFIGKFAIAYYLSNFSNVKMYGPAGSVILIILWVYYTAIILYLGVEFTQVQMLESGKKIIPRAYAERTEDRFKKVEAKDKESSPQPG